MFVVNLRSLRIRSAVSVITIRLVCHTRKTHGSLNTFMAALTVYCKTLILWNIDFNGTFVDSLMSLYYLSVFATVILKIRNRFH